MKLLIISHTEHYVNSDGGIVGWGPTIREINFLSTKFEEIYHCAPLHKTEAPPSSIGYKSSNIHFVALKEAGGSGVKNKLRVLTVAPHNIMIVRDTLKKVDVFQFRAPTGMGVYMIPYLNIFVNKHGWYKYAGNWIQEKPPLGYAIQKLLLKLQKKRKVTINGSWPKQPAHCITFENPCLSNEELEYGTEVIETKDYEGKLDFCFVGRLEAAKGVVRILKAFSSIGEHSRIGTVHFVGDGPDRVMFEKMAEEIPAETIFYGYLSRTGVAEVMKRCHVFLLPSDSEGFPKVLAEAANYGCLLVVSNVSSIPQYINDGVSGYLIDMNSDAEKELRHKLNALLENRDIKHMVLNAYEISKKFTFENYYNRIKEMVI